VRQQWRQQRRELGAHKLGELCKEAEGVLAQLWRLDLQPAHRDAHRLAQHVAARGAPHGQAHEPDALHRPRAQHQHVARALGEQMPHQRVNAVEVGREVRFGPHGHGGDGGDGALLRLPLLRLLQQRGEAVQQRREEGQHVGAQVLAEGLDGVAGALLHLATRIGEHLWGGGVRRRS